MKPNERELKQEVYPAWPWRRGWLVLDCKYWGKGVVLAAIGQVEV